MSYEGCVKIKGIIALFILKITIPSQSLKKCRDSGYKNQPVSTPKIMEETTKKKR